MFFHVAGTSGKYVENGFGFDGDLMLDICESIVSQKNWFALTQNGKRDARCQEDDCKESYRRKLGMRG